MLCKRCKHVKLNLHSWYRYRDTESIDSRVKYIGQLNTLFLFAKGDHKVVALSSDQVIKHVHED